MSKCHISICCYESMRLLPPLLETIPTGGKQLNTSAGQKQAAFWELSTTYLEENWTHKSDPHFKHFSQQSAPFTCVCVCPASFCLMNIHYDILQCEQNNNSSHLMLNILYLFIFVQFWSICHFTMQKPRTNCFNAVASGKTAHVLPRGLLYRR